MNAVLFRPVSVRLSNTACQPLRHGSFIDFIVFVKPYGP